MRSLTPPSILVFCLLCACTPDEEPDTDSESPVAWVDTHVHIGPIAQAQDAATVADSADALIDLMDGRGVEHGLVVVVPNTAPGANDTELADRAAAVAQHPDRLHLLAGGATLEQWLQDVDPGDVTPQMGDALETAAEQLLADGAVGFGEMISLHLCMSSTHSFQHVPANHPLFMRLAQVAGEHDVPIDLHMEAVPSIQDTPDNLLAACGQNPAQLPASIPPLEQLLTAHPNTRIVWQHMGWDNTGNMTPALVRPLLDAHANLFLGLRVEERIMTVGTPQTPMPNRILQSNGSIDPDWLDLIVDFPDRVMLGTDEFVTPDGSPTTGIESFQNTWDIVDQLPEEIREQVGGGNALRVYGLE